MDLQHGWAFAGASALVLALPGPTILLVVSYALNHGNRPLPMLIGAVALGDLVAMSACMLGLGALLATSHDLLLLLRWIGAAYLIFLGVQAWRNSVSVESMTGDGVAHWAGMGLKTFVVTLLNPKSLMFFVAFLPQFLDEGAPFLPQAGEMITIFVALAVLNTSLYALLAAKVRQKWRTPVWNRNIQRGSAGILICMGLLAISLTRV